MHEANETEIQQSGIPALDLLCQKRSADESQNEVTTVLKADVSGGIIKAFAGKGQVS